MENYGDTTIVVRMPENVQLCQSWPVLWRRHDHMTFLQNRS
jgi:hypothetical protein